MRSFRSRALHGTTALLALAAAACGGQDADDPASTTASTADAGVDGGGGVGGGGVDPDEFAAVPRSCAITCPLATGCDAPYACQNLRAWADLPHADTCAAWDGKPPASTKGACTASEPTGDAAKYTGPDPDVPTRSILPDGRFLQPHGTHWIFRENDVYAGMTTDVVSLGQQLALTVDTGYGDHVLRLVDGSTMTADGSADPVLQRILFPRPKSLNWGLAFASSTRVFVPTGDGEVLVVQVDPVAKTMTLDDAHAVKLPPSKDTKGNPAGWFASGLAASADGKRLVVAPVHEQSLLVYDVLEVGGSYGKLLAEIDLGAAEAFGAWIDPHDPAGRYAYVSMWASHEVVEVDLDATPPAVARRFQTAKDPQGVAFLDARWMVVANDFGDSLSLVDRATGEVKEIPIDAGTKLHGAEPSSIAYDDARQRLYVSLAAESALAAFDVDLGTTPPTLTPGGRLPTLWWPGGISVDASGGVFVASLRGAGTGPSAKAYNFPDDDVYKGLRGGVQLVPYATAGQLAASEAVVAASLAVGAREGRPEVTCPAGANDFPVPITNTEGPSKAIDHVFLVVKENKAYDAVFGDLPGAKGKADWMLKTDPKQMDSIWGNLRALGRDFAHADNFYTVAEISSLGHVWTTYGRSSDYNERTWAASYSRSIRPGDVQNGGVADVGKPVEGSMFDWLGTNGVPYDILGEGVGMPSVFVDGHSPIDFKYPGGFIQSPNYPDVEKACHFAARARVRCDLGNVAYLTLMNDHTQGLGAGVPTPESLIAMNDESAGMVVEAIAQSPLWRSSLVFVTEDDPAQGGDHVDVHRTVLAMASPWVKRGYVSHTHLDVSSIHKLVAHVFGLPYPNVEVANAALPLDVFTSTPDYTPWAHVPRSWPVECQGEASGTRSASAAGLEPDADDDEIDRDPELDAEVTRWMRGRRGLALPTADEVRAMRRR